MKKIILKCFLFLMLLCAGNAWADLNDGLIAYFPFNGNVNDESGNENDGTLEGVTLVEDRFGNADSAFSFDGMDDYIQTPINGNLLPLSYSVWFIKKLKESNSAENIIDSDVRGKYGHSLGVNSFSKLMVQYHNEWWHTEYSIPLGEWIHVVINYSNTIQIYVNGNFIDERDYPSTVLDGTNFRFGRHNSIDGNFFHGLIDDIHIYNRTLSEFEILQLYNINNCQSEYQEGFEAGKQFCINEPSECGITDGLYTEEDMQNMVNKLLQWDVNQDNKIGLVEAVKILRDTAGVIKSQKD